MPRKSSTTTDNKSKEELKKQKKSSTTDKKNKEESKQRKSNPTVDKKNKEELKQQILKEINTTVKDEIVKEVVSDIKKSIDTEYKDSIKREISEEITVDIKKNIEKEEKKLNRSKTFKIIRLYVYLIAVVFCAIYMIYRLYATDNLGIINEKLGQGLGTNTTTKAQVNGTTTEEVKDLNYYMERYGNLLDKIKISNTDLVKGSYTVESISIQDKLAMAFALLNEKVSVDGAIYTIDEESMKSAYEEVFGSLNGYEATSFYVRGLNFAYSSSTLNYLAVGALEEMSYVNNKIVNIYEENNIIALEAKVYIIKDDYVYNATNTSYRLVKVDDNLDISKIESRLSTVEYRFEKVDNQYRLLSITKK